MSGIASTPEPWACSLAWDLMPRGSARPVRDLKGPGRGGHSSDSISPQERLSRCPRPEPLRVIGAAGSPCASLKAPTLGCYPPVWLLGTPPASALLPSCQPALTASPGWGSPPASPQLPPTPCSPGSRQGHSKDQNQPHSPCSQLIHTPQIKVPSWVWPSRPSMVWPPGPPSTRLHPAGKMVCPSRSQFPVSSRGPPFRTSIPRGKPCLAFFRASHSIRWRVGGYNYILQIGAVINQSIPENIKHIM